MASVSSFVVFVIPRTVETSSLYTRLMCALYRVMDDDEDAGERCSFCGRRPSGDDVMVAGDDARICDHCIAGCAEIAAEEPQADTDASGAWNDEDEDEAPRLPEAPRVFFRLIAEADVARLLSFDDLLAALPAALRALSLGEIVQPLRTVLPFGDRDGALFVMPAYAGGQSILGAKLVTLAPANAALDLPSHLATMLLFSPETGALVAVMDGRLLTEMRTAAVSAISARLLARRDAARLAILGSSVQARSHLLALERVAALKDARVWSPTPEHVDAFLDEMTPLSTVTLAGADSPAEAVEGADIIVLATSSPEPVVRNEWVADGAHVISVGACRPDHREMDPGLVARGRLYVDSRAAALVESGDVVIGIRERRFDESHIAGEIGQVIAGTATGRRQPGDVTIFKSLGLAVEDLVAADLVYRRAVAEHLGRELEL